ncbi:hypothetical protein HRR78_003497 [Exophiala dermatitidis]|nr:hypothetical protein HRR78_003497 [Exophiala dermatitidis]
MPSSLCHNAFFLDTASAGACTLIVAMRYQNWDVLLFPGGSRVPIQEFDTKCYGLEQNVGIPVAQPLLDADRIAFESMTVVPTLTSFVASLEHGAPFRVSIHSWDKPKPSAILLNYKMPSESVRFQSRVYLDGGLVAQRMFEGGVWPEVIEQGEPQLRFPAFHKEILQQPHWEPGECLGRIKVVISEGVLREMTPPAPPEPMFDRLRDIIIFSFQHAPQNILEFSNIAWPNAKIFARLSKRPSRPAPIGTRLPPITGYEAHSHSPLRPTNAARSGKPPPSGFDGFQRLLNAQTFSDLQSDPISKAITLGFVEKDSPEHQEPAGKATGSDDPFICPQPISTQQWRLQLRSTSYDVSMPDYTSNKTDNSGACTEMSGASFPRANFLKHMNEANPEEIVQALSPDRQEELLKALRASQSPARGTHAPTNTPRSVSDQSRPQSPHLAARTEPSNVIKVEEVTGRGESNDGQWPRRVGNQEQRRRTYSESSIRSTCALISDRLKHDASPGSPRQWPGKEGAVSFGPLGAKSLSLNIHRQRSNSNASKRKRGSRSPLMKMGKTQGTIQVIMDSSSLGRAPGTGSQGGSPANRRIKEDQVGGE